jgi:hypothetical protein
MGNLAARVPETIAPDRPAYYGDKAGPLDSTNLFRFRKISLRRAVSDSTVLWVLSLAEP